MYNQIFNSISFQKSIFYSLAFEQIGECFTVILVLKRFDLIHVSNEQILLDFSQLLGVKSEKVIYEKRFYIKILFLFVWNLV